MSARKTEPTFAEQRFLAAVEQLRHERIRYSHREVKRRLGHRSISTTWQCFTQLMEKGFITRGDSELVWRKSPELTAKARRYLTKRAA